VENEESEKDASTALGPIQDSGSTDDVEYYEPVHASTRMASGGK